MHNELTIHRLLLKMEEIEASDLHLKIGSPPIVRVLLASPSVSDRIREGQEEDLYAIIADSIHDGMHTFTDSLFRLVTENYVDLKTAEQLAPHPEQLHSQVHGIAVKSDGLVSRLRKH